MASEPATLEAQVRVLMANTRTSRDELMLATGRGVREAMA